MNKKINNNNGKNYIGEMQNENLNHTKPAMEPRSKYDALTPIVVGIEQVRSIPRGEGFTRRLIDFAKDCFGVYKNIDIEDIIFNAKSVRHVNEHANNYIDLALLRHVPELIENGVYLETQTRKDNLVSHIFAQKINVEGENMAVGFVVREDTNGKRYYDHTSVKEVNLDDDAIPKSKVPTETGIGEKCTSPNQPAQYEPIHNIVKKHLNVNRKNKKINF